MGSCFKIYKSSAGSGKTHSLALEYILLSFRNPNYFKNILAVTFTNKATEEMKSRILEYLFRISNLETKEDEKIENIINILIKSGLTENDIRKRAKDILENILYNYTNFSISTIDSFFSRILRSFSKELKLQGNYEIEMDEGKVLSDIIKILWKKTSEDNTLLEYLNKFLHYRLTEGRSWNIDLPLLNIGSEIFRDRYWERKLRNIDLYDDSRTNINQFIEELRKIKSNFEDFLKIKVKDTELLTEKFNLKDDDFYGKNTRSIPAKLKKLCDLKVINLNDFLNYRDALEMDEKWYSKNSGKKSQIRECLDGGLRKILKDVIEHIENNFAKYISAKIILNNIFVFGIFTDLIKILKDYENEENIIISSNISRRLRTLITKNNSSFIYEKVGITFNNFLIDEFQDTSTFQWEILKPLILESLAKNELSLVVGDPKQTIYRWREGNMGLIVEGIYNDLKSFKDEIKCIELNTNYRSSETIVNFNNNFFQNILEGTEYSFISQQGKKLFDLAYGNIIQKNYKRGSGYVNITIIKKNPDLNNNLDNDDEEVLSVEETILEKIKAIINESLKKNFKKSDITILIRKSKEGTEIAKSLLEAGLEVISPDSLNIMSSPKVNLIISILKFIVNQKDNLSLTEFLNNKLRYIESQNIDNHKVLSTFLDIESQEKKDFSENLLWKAIPDSLKNIEEKYLLSSFVYNYNIYELVENLIRIFKLNDNADLYIIKFLDIIKEYSKDNSTDIKSFLDWLDTIKDDTNNSLLSISFPENTDAIKISTIHKIKGLQNKIIIIPYANWDIQLKGSRDIIWVSSNEEPFNKFPAYPVFATKDLEYSCFAEDYNLENDLILIDNLNLLYVAFTRAEDALFVISPERNKTINEIIETRVQKLEEEGGFFEEIAEENNKQFIIKTYSKGNFIPAKYINATCENNLFITEQSIVSSQWYKNILIKTADVENKPWDDNYQKIKRGIEIHKILSRLINPEDIENIIEDELIRDNLEEQEAELIKRKIKRLFLTKEFSLLFDKDWEVRIEAEIITQEGEILRPDRVLLKDKEVKIIDFKIGKENKEHITQINKYAKVLSEAGYKISGKYLIYLTDEIKIIEV